MVGSLDVALPSRKIAIFIDGDFWHGYKFSQRKARLPVKYWQNKIETNMKRDKRNRARLRKLGWKVLRVWEHEVRKGGIEKIVSFLKK